MSEAGFVKFYILQHSLHFCCTMYRFLGPPAIKRAKCGWEWEEEGDILLGPNGTYCMEEGLLSFPSSFYCGVRGILKNGDPPSAPTFIMNV